MLYYSAGRSASPRLARPTFLSRGAAGRIGWALGALAPLWLALAFVLGWLG
jgi:hypothetical protein